MTIGAANPLVPDVYVNVLAPRGALPRGVATDQVGFVGTAAWGPVNSPTPFGSAQDYALKFANPQNRKYDMGSAVLAATMQGAQNNRGVRVTDGTDAAAAITTQLGTQGAITVGGAGYVVGDIVKLSNGALVQVATVSSGAIATFTKLSEPTAATAGTLTSTAVTGVGAGATFATWSYTAGPVFTSKYSGTGANADTVTISAGSAASSYKLTVARAGRPPEVFDNITGAANALYVAMAAAINSGLNGQRGPSDLIVATAGAATAAPAVGQPTVLTLTGGTDGVTSITATTLLGADTGTRSGMYALRGIGPTAATILVDADASASWSAQVAFGLTEGHYMILVGPAGEYTNLSTVATNKASAGIDSYAAKLLVGDWCYFVDGVNGGITRMISPQGFVAGRLATIGPEQSSLNKAINGIVATQKSLANQTYSSADLTILGAAGLDIIANPNPGGAYFACRQGLNTSSDSRIHDDNYSRLTPYFSTLLGQIGAQYVGKLQTPDQQVEAQGAFDAALYGEQLAGRCAASKTVIGATNNPPSNQARGIETADVQIQYASIIRTFLVNLEAGQTVQPA